MRCASEPVVGAESTGGGWHWEQLDTSSAWNSHSGPHLQWLGPSSRYAVFNDRQCGADADAAAAAAAAALQGACAVVYDLQLMTRARVLPHPLAAVSRDGGRAASLDFRRLDVARPGGWVCFLLILSSSSRSHRDACRVPDVSRMVCFRSTRRQVM